MNNSKRQEKEEARNDSKHHEQREPETATVKARSDSKHHQQAQRDSKRQEKEQASQDESQEEQAKNPAGERRITYIAIVILLVGVASIAGVSTLDYFKGEGFFGKSTASDAKKPTESKK